MFWSQPFKSEKKKEVALEIRVCALSFFLPLPPKIPCLLSESRWSFTEHLKQTEPSSPRHHADGDTLFQILAVRSHSLTPPLPVCFFKLRYPYCKEYFLPQRTAKLVFTHIFLHLGGRHLAAQGSSSAWCWVTITWCYCYCGPGKTVVRILPLFQWNASGCWRLQA